MPFLYLAREGDDRESAGAPAHDKAFGLRLHGALLVRLAQVLKTTPDAILAVMEFAPDGESGTLDRRFVRRLQRLDKLSACQKKILLGTIDAFLSKVS